jgi:hypothetical protein
LLQSQSRQSAGEAAEQDNYVFEQVKKLSNDQQHAVTAKPASLKWLKDKMVREDDVGIIFHSGHGDRDSDGIFYVLPFELDPARLDETAAPGEMLKKKLSGTKR